MIQELTAKLLDKFLEEIKNEKNIRLKCLRKVGKEIYRRTK